MYTKDQWREYRKKNITKIRETERRYRENNRTKISDRSRLYAKLNKEKRRAYEKDSRKNDSLKYRARDKMKYEIEAGRLIRKSCELCGNEKADGHHIDYSRPLDVIWLCRKHHMEQHRLI